jgi:hypothetical protein
VGDLERKAVWRRLLVQPAAVSRGKRSAKLFEDTALACGVLGVLVDRTGLVKVILVASTILMVESRFDLDLALHVARCYVSGIAQAKRHAGGRRSRARTLDALTDFDCIGDHIPDMINPSDQVARSGWVFFNRSVSIYWLVVTVLPSMTRQAARVVDVAGIEPK